MHGAAIPKLSQVTDETIIQACIGAADIVDAADILGVGRKTIHHELSRRRLPGFADLRGKHGVPTNLGGGVVKWTDAQVEQLRKLHQQGLSATLIGEQIGMTKNAVCGKANRIGLVLGTPLKKAPVTKPRSPRPPSTLKGKPRPPRKVVAVVPAANTLSKKSNSPVALPSVARAKAAAQVSAATRAADREMIDRAIAEGRITNLPSGHAYGTQENTWAQVAQS